MSLPGGVPMRVPILAATLLALACQSLQDGGPDAGEPVVSPPGYYHLPNGSMATTLALLADGGATVWTWECDSIGLFEMAWHATSTSTVELSADATIRVLTTQDGGLAVVDPPFFPARAAPPEVWLPGASCSVCTPGLPLAAVGCRTPEDGAEALCCSASCAGGLPVSPVCTPMLMAGRSASAIAGGQVCSCPAGSVSASDCTAYPKVFCGRQ